ncbi:MAG: amidohydrolase [Hyphomicrobiales bacterium]
MPDHDPIIAASAQVVAWRHLIHRNPELGFEEHETARFVAEKLQALGLEVHQGIGGTGVVGVLRHGGSGRAIGLRAELDALPIRERTGKPYASARDGVMHACGHDGHAAILLGAAGLLAQSRAFDGSVYFIFQPAEEVLGGGMKMIEAGLFERFPLEGVYAIHNWPGLPLGAIATRPGPMMAAVDDFELRFTGTGCHAAMPHLGDDPILAAAEYITSVQRIVSRSIDPHEALVVSITQVRAGSVNNTVPGEVVIEGTCRFLEARLSDHCERQLGEIAAGVALAHGVAASLTYRKGYPPLLNTVAAAANASRAARATVGDDRLITEFRPSMGCEDFAYMTKAAGGAYAWIGAGEIGPRRGLHGDCYDFNDETVPVALRYFVNLVQQVLAPAPSEPARAR